MSSAERLRPLLIFCGASLLVYLRTLSYGYTNFDDNQLIRESRDYLSQLSNVWDAFRTTVFRTSSDVFYRPMETIWFILCAQLAGDHLMIYHLGSILLHGLAVYLFFLLLNRLGAGKEGSWIFSVIFLVHPLSVQAVAWVPGVVDILVTVFMLLAFMRFQDFSKDQQRSNYVLHLLFFLLALFTKEIAIVLPALIMFFGWMIDRTWLRRVNLKSVVPGWMVVLLVWLLMRDAAIQDNAMDDKGGVAGIFSGIIHNLPALLTYLGKVLLPFNLSVLPVLRDMNFIWGLAALLLTGAVLWKYKNRKLNLLVFGVFWFVVLLLPTFIPTHSSRAHHFYEHRMYLPMIGWILVFLSGEMAWPSWGSKTIRRVIAIGVVLLFLFINIVHQGVFASTEAFLVHATEKAPSSSLAFRNMGIFRQEQNRLKEAEVAYLKALELNPAEKDLHGNLGVIYNGQGKLDRAEKEYRAELKLNPGSSQSWHNLGMLHAGRKEYPAAIECYKKALAIREQNETYQQLALAYDKTGNKKELSEIMKKLTGSAVQVMEPAINRAKRLMSQGDLPGAERALKEELARDSAQKEVLFELGLVYYTARQMPEAEKYWRRVLVLDPSFKDAYNNLGICLVQQGKMDDAEKVLKDLVKEHPDYADGLFNLANFYARTGKDEEARKIIKVMMDKGYDKAYFDAKGVRFSRELYLLFEE